LDGVYEDTIGKKGRWRMKKVPDGYIAYMALKEFFEMYANFGIDKVKIMYDLTDKDILTLEEFANKVVKLKDTNKNKDIL
jgi:hypothetical protein